MKLDVNATSSINLTPIVTWLKRRKVGWVKPNRVGWLKPRKVGWVKPNRVTWLKRRKVGWVKPNTVG